MSTALRHSSIIAILWGKKCWLTLVILLLLIIIIATIELWRHLVLASIRVSRLEAPSLVFVTKASVLSPSCFVDYFNPVSSIIIPIIHVNNRDLVLASIRVSRLEAPSLVFVTKASVLSPSCFVDYFNPVSSIIIPIIHVNNRETICLLNRVIPLNTASLSPLKYIVPIFGFLYLDLLIGY